MATTDAPHDLIEKKLDMALEDIVQEEKTQQQQPERSPPPADGRARSTKRAERLAQTGPYEVQHQHRGTLSAAVDVEMDVDLADNHVTEDASAGRRVYVGNLSWSVKWQELKDHMKQAGQVEHAVVLETNGRSKGCGIVTFATQDEAQRAIQSLNDTELEGRKIFVREDREEHAGTNAHKGTRVFVGNLSWKVKWQQLKDHMKQAGNVIHADVLMESTGRSKGCGMVEYAREEEAKLAIGMLHDSVLDGRKIFVREDREPEGGSISSIAKRATMRGAAPTRPPPPQLAPPLPVVASGGAALYVGNLPWDVTWQTLKDVFRQVGNVEHAEVAQFPNGRSRGFGIVRFMNPQDALQAIVRLNGTELNGRTIEVRYDKAK